MDSKNTTTRVEMKRIEMKFQLSAELSLDVQSWARDHLGIDHLADSDGGDSYDVNTLYLDTAELDLFRASGRVGRIKHRIRRYGDEPTLWVETKRKKKMVVRKNRTSLFESDFASGRSVQQDDPRCDDWFIERLASCGLRPAIRLAYRRFARTSTLNGRNMRLTIDRQMFASRVDGWSVPTTSQFRQLERTPFGDHEILELKFSGNMPVIFKQLLQTFAIPAAGFSKYRTAMNACLPIVNEVSFADA